MSTMARIILRMEIKTIYEEIPAPEGFHCYYMVRGIGGSGYVGVHKNHPLFGVDYSNQQFDLDVHGGITYSKMGSKDREHEKEEYYYLGWDANHHCNMEETANNTSYGIPVTRDFIRDETQKLLQQMINYRPQLSRSSPPSPHRLIES